MLACFYWLGVQDQPANLVLRDYTIIFLNTGQQLEVENDTGVGTVIDVKTLPYMDNKNSIGKNSNINMEMEIIFNYIENLPGQNKSSLRSWKCILHSSNNQASLNNLTKLHQSCKRPSSASSFVDSFTKNKLSALTVCVFFRHLLGVIFCPLLQHEDLSLNCRGLRIPVAVQILCCLAREESPKILFFFLSETRLDMDGFHRLKKKLVLRTGFYSPQNWFKNKVPFSKVLRSRVDSYRLEHVEVHQLR